MFLPATKIRVIASTAKHGKTKLKKDSLLYVAKCGGLNVPSAAKIRRKFNGSIIVMPAEVVVTRYGNETRRRAEVRPTLFVFPMVNSGEQSKDKCLQNILSELKEYDTPLLNPWARNKHGAYKTNLDYIVGYPTLEETGMHSTVDELAAWLYSVVNNMFHYCANPLSASMEHRARILNDFNEVFPTLRYKIHRDDAGLFNCQHINDFRTLIAHNYDNIEKMEPIIKWALSQKALMARRLFHHNAGVYDNHDKILRKLTLSMVVPKPILIPSEGWEQLAQKGATAYRKLKYCWLTATNNLPVNYQNSGYQRMAPWVDYFKSTLQGCV